MGAPIATEEGRQDVFADREARANGESPARQVAQAVDGLDDFVRDREHAFAVLGYRPTDVGEGDPAADAVDEDDPEILLELADLRGDSRLTDLQFARRAGEAP